MKSTLHPTVAAINSGHKSLEEWARNHQAHESVLVLEYAKLAIALSKCPYRHYLGTIQWATLRGVVLARDFMKCRGCGSESNLQVHHKTYKRCGHELLEDLITLCDICHSKHHGKYAELWSIQALTSMEAGDAGA